MQNRFINFIHEQHLFAPEQKVLLAVSGGRDSVVLTHLMRQSGFQFAIAHCNFHLRTTPDLPDQPAPCDRDQQFVSSLAHNLHVPFFTTDFDAINYAKQHNMSIEEAARDLRYQWFAHLCHKHNYHCVATAHHRDDSIETFFLNLLRGTGISGLHGIRPSSFIQVPIIHPLLPFSREEINSYIAQHHLDYVDDLTNYQPTIRRNQIRLQLIPLLRQISPSFDQQISATINHLYDTELIFHNHIELLRQQLIQSFTPRVIGYPAPIHSLSLESIRQLSPQRTLLFELLRPYSISAPIVDDILRSINNPQTGKQFLSPTHRAVIDRDQLLIAPLVPPTAPTLSYNELTLSEFHLPSHNNEILIDADLIHPPLFLRPWQPSDRFIPFGMHNSRLVSDLLSDLKLSRIEKDCVHLLIDSSQRIVWVVGLRADNRFRISPTTQHILHISAS